MVIKVGVKGQVRTKDVGNSVGSIPDGVVMISHCLNISGRTVYLNRPRNEYQDISWGVKAAGA